MPGHAAHIELAARSRGLFPAGDEVTNALYHGALAPDMGMFPGADPLFSDLAHYVRSADLARSLVACARNDVEQAYAWGWVSHLLADSGLHPAINQASGFVPWSDSKEPHLRVEFGLDFARLANQPWLRRVRLVRMRELQFVVNAYRDTFGVELEQGRLRRSHATLTASQRVLFTLGPKTQSLGPVRWLGSRFRGSVLAAITTPIEPEAYLLEGLALMLGEMPGRMGALMNGGLADLENLNLDTGERQGPSDPDVARVLAALEERLRT